MAKKRKQSLEQWCQDNDREDLLQEWDEEKNSNVADFMSCHGAALMSCR